jgi:hypothetical protein
MNTILAYSSSLLLCCAFYNTDLIAQAQQFPDDSYLREEFQPRPFSEVDWNEATKDLSYTLEPEKAERKQNQQKQESEQLTSDSDWRNMLDLAQKIFKILAVGILLILAAFVLSQLIKKPRNSKIPSRQSPFSTMEPDRPPSFGLDAHIWEAESSGDFGTAVRFRYLRILQALERSKWIIWKKEKTNLEYARELKQAHFTEAFQLATLIFDRVRYGEYLPDEMQYQQEIVPLFTGLLDRVEQTVPKNPNTFEPTPENHA